MKRRFPGSSTSAKDIIDALAAKLGGPKSENERVAEESSDSDVEVISLPRKRSVQLI